MGLLQRVFLLLNRTRDSLAIVRSLFDPIQIPDESRTMERAHKSSLDQDQMLKVEEKLTAIIQWIHGEGGEKMNQLGIENIVILNDILEKQKIFEAFHSLATKQVENGFDLLTDFTDHMEEITANDAAVTSDGETQRKQLIMFRDELAKRKKNIEDCVYVYSELHEISDWTCDAENVLSNTESTINVQEGTLSNHIETVGKCIERRPCDETLQKLCRIVEELNHINCLQYYDIECEKYQRTFQRLKDKVLVMETIIQNDTQLEQSSEVLQILVKDEIKEAKLVEGSSDYDQEDDKTEDNIYIKEKEVTNEEDLFSKITGLGLKTEPNNCFPTNGSLDSGISVSEKNGVYKSCQDDIQEDNKTEVAVGSADRHIACGDNQCMVQYNYSQDNIKEDRVVDKSYDTKDLQSLIEEFDSTTKIGTYLLGDEIETQLDRKRNSAPANLAKSISEPHSMVDNISPGVNNKMLLLLEEMNHTEEVFVKALKYTMDNYIPEMDRDDIPHGLRGLRSVVFGNVEKIHFFHEHQLLPNLRKYKLKPTKVGECFLKYRTEFGLHSLYSKNKPKSDNLLAEYGNLFELKQKQLEDSLGLRSHLLKPVQRLGKYSLFLQDLITQCNSSSQDRVMLRDADDMIQFHMRHGNDLLAMDHIKDVDFNIREQGELIRQEKFTIYRGRRKAKRHVFLFEEMIVFTKHFKKISGLEEYRYKFSLKMTDIGLTETIGETGLKFQIWFRRINSDRAYTLQSTSLRVKQEWTHSISRILWNQALRSKENHEAELRSMGLESKPNLDLKPSKNRIESRSIKVAVIKERRMRSTSLDSPLHKSTSLYLLSISPDTSPMLQPSWLGAPPPSIPTVPESNDEEMRGDDFLQSTGQSSEGRTDSDFEAFSLSDHHRNRHGGSLTSLDTVDTLHSRMTDIQSLF